MSMMVSFVLSFFPRDVLDEILNLIESVSEDFPSYFFNDIGGYDPLSGLYWCDTRNAAHPPIVSIFTFCTSWPFGC